MSEVEVICNECGGNIVLTDEHVKGHNSFFCRRCYDRNFTMYRQLLILGEHTHIGSVVVTHEAVGQFAAECILCDYREVADTQAAITWSAFCHNMSKRKDAPPESREQVCEVNIPRVDTRRDTQKSRVA